MGSVGTASTLPPQCDAVRVAPVLLGHGGPTWLHVLPRHLAPLGFPMGAAPAMRFSPRSACATRLFRQTLKPLSGREHGADHLGGISGYTERGK